MYFPVGKAWGVCMQPGHQNSWKVRLVRLVTVCESWRVVTWRRHSDCPGRGTLLRLANRKGVSVQKKRDFQSPWAQNAEASRCPTSDVWTSNPWHALSFNRYPAQRYYQKINWNAVHWDSKALIRSVGFYANTLLVCCGFCILSAFVFFLCVVWGLVCLWFLFVLFCGVVWYEGKIQS